MAITKELFDKFEACGNLTDMETYTLFLHYGKLKSDMEGFCPPQYRMFRDDINKQFERISMYRDSRKNCS